MIDFKVMEKVVCDIVKFVTNLPAEQIIIGDPNTGAPKSAYCAVRLQNDEAFGQAQKLYESVPALDNPLLDDYMDHTDTQKVLIFSVNFYRNNARQYAAAMREANKREPVKSILRANGLGWSYMGPTNNLTGLYSGAQEERIQFNLHLYAQDSVQDRIQRIYQVEYSVSNEQDQQLIQGNVNGLPG